MNSKEDANELPVKSSLDDETEKIFVILENELISSETNNSYENMILKIKNIDNFIPYKIIISSINKLLCVNMGLFFVSCLHIITIYKKFNVRPLPKEVAVANLPILFLMLVSLCFFPTLFLIQIIAIDLSQRSTSKDILQNIKKKIIAEKSKSFTDFELSPKKVQSFALDFLKAHFEYLLKEGEKQKDRGNSIIPIFAAVVVLVSYYIGIPKETFEVLNRSSKYESLAILAGFLTVIYAAFLQFSHARLSIKFLKCISTIEKLRSLNHLNDSSKGEVG